MSSNKIDRSTQARNSSEKPPRSSWQYFRTSLFFTAIGLMAAFAIGWQFSVPPATGAARSSLETGLRAGGYAAFICLILTVLEVSLSFDNAVMNALTIRKMTPRWRHYFLTWGMLIAVFGMRLVFPLAIVSILARISPLNALILAATRPDDYAELMLSVHLPVSAFGGAFLLMVALNYFFDACKDIHWIHPIEMVLAKIGRLQSVALAIGLMTIYGVSRAFGTEEAHSFLSAGIGGLITFILIDGISSLLAHEEDSPAAEANTRRESPPRKMQSATRASVGLFLYLEVLDASFSFDGVVGAFAITNNLFIITIGLGIGAFFVRSMTIVLVDRGAMSRYFYLEHGAFYAIGALAIIMFLNTVYKIPEIATSLVGATLIGLSFLSSVRRNKRDDNDKGGGRIPTTLAILMISVSAFLSNAPAFAATPPNTEPRFDTDVRGETKFFSTELVKPNKKPRRYLFPPLISFLLPGFDQWYEHQLPSAFAYSGTATIGFGLMAEASGRVGSRSTSLSSRDDSLRSVMLGSQLYQAAGSLSAYHSFRTAVRSRKDLGQFAFLPHEETTDELLMSPFQISLVTRPTTFLPLLVALGFAALDAGQNGAPFEHNGYSIGDFGFGTGFSYIAGTNEEALFRGYMMPALMQWWDNRFWSNTTTALVFGAAHLSGENTFPLPQLLLGWYLGYVSQRNEWTLKESIFIHAWWDVIVFAGAYLHESRDPAYKSMIYLPLISASY